MLIAISSDLHDNIANWRLANNYLKKQGIKTLLFCGDLTNSESLNEIASSFSGKIYIISGNAELYQEEEMGLYKNLEYLGRYGDIELGGKKIGLIHEIRYKEKMPINKLDYLFYGHDHKPWIQEENGLIIANAGTLGGVFYKASFAILDTENGKLELKILEQL